MAERGFVTLSLICLSGERVRPARQRCAPDIYAEDFSAAVDFPGTRPFVDKDRIGVLGFAAAGAFAISAAKIDPRMKSHCDSQHDMTWGRQPQRA